MYSYNKVVDGYANLTLGAFTRTYERDKIMTATHTYVQVTLSFAISPKRDISTSLGKLIAPFNIYVWLSMILTLSSGIIIIFYTKSLSRSQRHFIIGGRVNRTPILNMIGTSLGGAMTNRYLNRLRLFGTFSRTMLMIWLLSCLILRGSYQGALYDYFRKKVLSSPYDTVQKLFASDCKLYVMATALGSLERYKLDKSR